MAENKVEVPLWRRQIREGMSLQEVINGFLEQQVSIEPDQEGLIEDHEWRIGRYQRMTRGELEIQLSLHQRIAETISQQGENIQVPGTGISHIQWRIRAIKDVLGVE